MGDIHLPATCLPWLRFRLVDLCTICGEYSCLCEEVDSRIYLAWQRGIPDVL